MPATGMVGITQSVATSAMKDAPCTPLALMESQLESGQGWGVAYQAGEKQAWQ
jgi:hypothetical protein